MKIVRMLAMWVVQRKLHKFALYHLIRSSDRSELTRLEVLVLHTKDLFGYQKQEGYEKVSWICCHKKVRDKHQSSFHLGYLIGMVQ